MADKKGILPFLEFPREIRDQIYIDTFANNLDETLRTVPSSSSTSLSSSTISGAFVASVPYPEPFTTDHRDHSIMSLLNVCHQIRDEIMDIIYKAETIDMVLFTDDDYAQLCHWILSGNPKSTLGCFGFNFWFNGQQEMGWRKDWFYDDPYGGKIRGLPSRPEIFVALDENGKPQTYLAQTSAWQALKSRGLWFQTWKQSSRTKDRRTANATTADRRRRPRVHQRSPLASDPDIPSTTSSHRRRPSGCIATQ